MVRHMTAEARKAISRAQKARWKSWKKSHAKNGPKLVQFPASVETVSIDLTRELAKAVSQYADTCDCALCAIIRQYQLLAKQA